MSGVGSSGDPFPRPAQPLTRMQRSRYDAIAAYVKASKAEDPDEVLARALADEVTFCDQQVLKDARLGRQRLP